MHEWLYENAGETIRFNLSGRGSYERLLSVPEVQYWLGKLDERQRKGMIRGNIHGSHDYRFENILGKLVQLGLRAGMPALDERMAPYRADLAQQVAMPRQAQLSFAKLYSYYDHELIPATFLALAGYEDEAVKEVRQRRLELLYDYTKQAHHEFYVDGSRLPGVPPEWQRQVIDPDLYADGHIRLPVIHDYLLLGTLLHPGEAETIAKLDTITGWLFDPRYAEIPVHYGYFWIPGGSYSAKAVCWKLDLPELNQLADQPHKGQALILRALWLQRYSEPHCQAWVAQARQHLESFQTEDGKFLFPKEYLVERADGYWVFGAHMGMAENRRQARWRQVESTYWMERLQVPSA